MIAYRWTKNTSPNYLYRTLPLVALGTNSFAKLVLISGGPNMRSRVEKRSSDPQNNGKQTEAKALNARPLRKQ